MKKFNKNSVLALSLAAASTIAIGGTVAYNAFTHDDESAVNTYSVDEAVDIAINEYQRTEDGSALEAFDQGKKLYPIVGSAQADANSSNMDKWGMPTAENYGDKIVTIKNTGDVPAKIRVFIAKPLALADLAKDGNDSTTDDPLHTNLGNRVNLSGEYTDAIGDAWKENWGWSYYYSDPNELFVATIDGEDYEVATYYLDAPLAPDAESTAVMAGAYLDANVDYDDGTWKMGDYAIEYDLAKGIKIPVYAEAIAANADFENTAKEAFELWADSIKEASLISNGETVINKSIILDDNGEATDCVTAIGEDTVVTINGGYYDAAGKDCAVWAKDGAKVIINDGTFTCGEIEGEVNGGNHSDLIYAGANGGVIEIYGGYFKTATPGDWILNEKDNQGTIIVYGGTFVNFNPADNAAEGVGTNFLAEGYTVEITESGNDTIYTVIKAE